MLREENSELSRRIFVFHISLFSPIFNCVDSDPDPYSEYGSSLDPDPQHLLPFGIGIRINLRIPDFVCP